MPRIQSLFRLLIILVVAAPLAAQIVNLTIPAGSPEDQASQSISNEADAQKRLAMWSDFVQKYASNPMAVAYGNLQIAQQLQSTGDAAGALAASEKAYTALPANFDVVISAVSTAQQAKNTAKTVEYAAKGGMLYNSIGQQKPATMSDADFATQAQQLRAQYQQQYDFLETAAFNAIAQETGGKARMAYIDAFTPAFPKSKFSEQVAQLAIYSLSQMKDSAALAAYGEKALAASPDSVTTLALLASAFAEEASGAHLTKATEYAHRAIELSKDKTEGSQLLSAGLAHSALGYALLRQDGLNAPKPGPRTPAAIGELRVATNMLKADPGAHSNALYWLGYACAKSAKFDEARSALTEAAGIPGPYQQPSRELLAKVNAARSKTR